LVVDPVIGNSRFSKVLMDGGNNLNILYVHTLQLMGLGWTSCGPDRPVGLVRHAGYIISARKRSPLRWWGSGVCTRPYLGSRATLSSWRSRTTRTSR
jgi:hypothetical protein